MTKIIVRNDLVVTPPDHEAMLKELAELREANAGPRYLVVTPPDTRYSVTLETKDPTDAPR